GRKRAVVLAETRLVIGTVSPECVIPRARKRSCANPAFSAPWRHFGDGTIRRVLGRSSTLESDDSARPADCRWTRRRKDGGQCGSLPPAIARGPDDVWCAAAGDA